MILEEVMVTKKYLDNHLPRKILEEYGHTFRLAKHCPKGYQLYTDEFFGTPWLYYKLKNGDKLYHTFRRLNEYTTKS